MVKKSDRNNDPTFSLIPSDDPIFCSRSSPMTVEELEILAAMRNLKTQARAIKTQLAEILPEWKQWIHKPRKATNLDHEADSHLQQLDELRIKWKECEKAYQEARHRRMVALGHEDL